MTTMTLEEAIEASAIEIPNDLTTLDVEGITFETIDEEMDVLYDELFDHSSRLDEVDEAVPEIFWALREISSAFAELLVLVEPLVKDDSLAPKVYARVGRVLEKLAE